MAASLTLLASPPLSSSPPLSRHTAMIESRRGLLVFSFDSRGLAAVGEDGAAARAVDAASLLVDDDVQFLLKDVRLEPWFKEALERATDPKDFAREVKDIVMQMMSSSSSISSSSSKGAVDGGAATTPPPVCSVKSRFALTDPSESRLPLVIIKEIEQIGWSRIADMNEDMTALCIRTEDSTGRSHVFDVAIPPSYPRSAPRVRVGVPGGALSSVHWLPGASSLASVLQTVTRDVCKYEKLFEVLSDIDRNAWVLEPDAPTFEVTSRRIVLDRACSLLFDVNPLCPTAPLGDTTFFGPAAQVAAHKAALHANAHLWDHRDGFVANLQRALGTALPRKEEAAAGDSGYLAECGVCYAYALDSGAGAARVPDQACANPRCHRVYHHGCLLEWVQSVPTSRKSFGSIFGSCPYCCEPMSVKLHAR